MLIFCSSLLIVYEGYEENPMQYPTMDIEHWLAPHTPLGASSCKSFDYQADNSIDDEEDLTNNIAADYDDAGHEGGDELDANDSDENLHLVAASDSGNASATNSSAGGEQCCFDANMSNDSNAMELNLNKPTAQQQNDNVMTAVQESQHHHHHAFTESAAHKTPTNSCLSASSSQQSSCSPCHSELEEESNAATEIDMMPPPCKGKSAEAVGSTATPAFIPISEETVFLDPEPPMPSISTSSPHSGDSWMNYSSNSSDDFSGLSEQIKAVASGRQTCKFWEFFNLNYEC